MFPNGCTPEVITRREKFTKTKPNLCKITQIRYMLRTEPKPYQTPRPYLLNSRRRVPSLESSSTVHEGMFGAKTRRAQESQ